MRYTTLRLAAITVVLMVFAAACWKPELTPTYDVTVISDVVYGQGEVDGGGTFDDLMLDLYIPTVEGQDLFPLVVVIHGGGFTGGSKSGSKFVQWADGFASRGYLVASIDYRLVGDDPIPSGPLQPIYDLLGGPSGPAQFIAALAAMEDTLAALDFLHARPDVEPLQTVLTGSSAGAITALYVGYSMDDFGVERPPVSAVISNWGGFAATPGNATAIEPDNGVILDPPYFYAEGPVFLAHATGDATVSYSLSVDIADRADEVGHPYEFFTLDANVHGFDLFTTEFSPGVSVFQAQVDWLDSFMLGVAETP